MTSKRIAHIAHRMFLRNATDPDLPNFWIAQAKAIQADLTEPTRTSRTAHGEPQPPDPPRHRRPISGGALCSSATPRRTLSQQHRTHPPMDPARGKVEKS
jgi:hypothetical protein